MEKGHHILIDCRNVPRDVCLDDGKMLDAMARSAAKAGMHVISQVRYHFGHNSAPGFTCVCLLDESHVSAHTYADLGLIALDVFTCGKTDPAKILAGGAQAACSFGASAASSAGAISATVAPRPTAS